LVDRDDLLHRKIAFQIGEGQRERRTHMSTDRQAIGRRVDLIGQAGQMIAHEEGVVGRQHALAEHRKGRFQLGRTLGQADHRPFLGIAHQRTFAIVERQADAARSCEKRSGEQGRSRLAEKNSPGKMRHAAMVAG